MSWGRATQTLRDAHLPGLCGVQETQAKQRSCIVHDCKKIAKIKQVSGSVVSGAVLGLHLDIFSADPEGQCEHFILDLSDPLHGCPSWVCNTSCLWDHFVLDLSELGLWRLSGHARR